MKNLFSTKFGKKNALKIISNKYKFIYIENPLAASQTVLDLFIYNPPLDFDSYLIKNDLKELLNHNQKYEKYLKFCITRNPWSRVVSCYNKKILNANIIVKIGIICQYKGLYPLMSFENFVNWLCSKEGQDKFADPHWISQYRILFDEKERPRYNYNLKFEELNAEFIKFFQKLNIPQVKLPEKKKSKDQLFKPLYDSWMDYYRELDDTLLEKIELRYKKDAELLGYQKLRKALK
ncbi:MAG: hypothetical protein EU529_04215 [Promethearchaeota archaeon]|nr:MAG: hypothetical protein EU529_04215 [Candidatus Lokiarchaeota archaeon]